MPSLVVYHPQQLVSEVYASLLQQHGLDAAGCASTMPDVLRLIAQNAPDLVLMTPSLPALTELAQASTIQALSPHTQITLLIDTVPDVHIPRLIRAQVGYVSTHSSFARLLEAIIAATKGVPYRDETLIPHPQLLRVVRQQDSHMTDAERRVLEAAVTQGTAKDIGRALCLSEETVKSHLSHIYRKLGVHKRHHAITKAISQGIIEPQ